MLLVLFALPSIASADEMPRFLQGEIGGSYVVGDGASHGAFRAYLGAHRCALDLSEEDCFFFAIGPMLHVGNLGLDGNTLVSFAPELRFGFALDARRFFDGTMFYAAVAPLVGGVMGLRTALGVSMMRLRRGLFDSVFNGSSPAGGAAFVAVLVMACPTGFEVTHELVVSGRETAQRFGGAITYGF